MIVACLTVITPRIQLRIHDIVINIFHDGKHRIQIMFHVGYFNITDGAARRQLLELRLKLQLFKGVDVLCHMYMVTVGNIILICHTFYHTEPVLQTLREFISS